MPRGYDWKLYAADDGGLYALRVDADYALQSGRGFATNANPGTPPLPRGWLPRRVRGVEPTGRLHTATVASVEAPLWTGAETTFDIVDSNGDLQTCVVTGRLQERARDRP